MKIEVHNKNPFKKQASGRDGQSDHRTSPSNKIVSCFGNIEDFNGLLDYQGKRADNAVRMSDTIRSDSNSAWKGGTLAEAKTLPQLDAFYAARDRLVKKGFVKTLTPTMHTAPKRQRRNSEYDGDFDFDKRWEIKPFQQTVKQRALTPIVKINADISIHCQYSSEQINEFGAICWAINSLLESRGVNTEIVLSKYIFKPASNGTLDIYGECMVKEATKYVSPQALAHAFRAVFVRRQTHALIVAMCDHADLDVDYGLGVGYPPSKSAEYKDGELRLGIGALGDLQAVENALKGILG